MNKMILCLCILLITLGGCTNVDNNTTNQEQGSDVEQVTKSSTITRNGFEMKLFSDKQVYRTTDEIQIWATLEYIGKGDTVTIWSGEPFMVFSITDGKDFNSSGMVLTVLKSTVLEKGSVYRFDYQKSGGWDANAPDASFWEEFYSKQELFLPVGEYTITVRGDFSLTENVVDSKSDLVCELAIKVVE